MAQDDIDVKKFHTGVIGSPPEALVVQIPIAEYASQGVEGLDMFYGKLKRIEVMGSNMIREAVARNQQRTGIVKPNLTVS